MNDVKLRMDYFLSLGLKLADGDIYLSMNGDMFMVGDDIEAMHANVVSERDKEKFIVSLAPRKNTGVQPVGDSVPVIVYWGHDNSDESLFGATDWEIELDNINIATWKPSIDALIKMQIQNDELNSSDIEWKNGDECISNGDLFYYVGKTPLVKHCTYGDCIIQLYDGRPAFAFISELTKPETQEQKAERELDTAKERQIELAVKMLNTELPFEYVDICKKMQDSGMLAEILLPLEK